MRFSDFWSKAITAEDFKLKEKYHYDHPPRAVDL